VVAVEFNQENISIENVLVKDIRHRFRLRSPKEERIKELANSIASLGLVNPITIDNQNYLIAGFHRLHACKSLGHVTIPAIRKDTSKEHNELIEIDENLKRIELNKIEKAEHMVRREELLSQLGVRMKTGGNQYVSGMVTTKDLAEQMGMSSRIYRLNRQPANINEEVKDLLRETEWADNLMNMVKLEQQSDDVQLKIANLLITGKCQTFQRAFVEANIQDYRKKTDYKIDFDMKERWGVPHSIMRFTKAKKELQQVCDLVGKEPELGWEKRSVHFGTSKIPVYGMAADHAEFLVTYYTPEGGLVLDNFMGRATNGIASLWHGRRFIGYDVHKPNVDKLREVLEQHYPGDSSDYQLFHSDGISLKELADKEEYLDAVVTDPPYVLNAERYSKDERDISSMKHDDYMNKIKENFEQLYRLIKTSNFEEKVFYPVIFKVGTGRRGKEGIVDMDCDFQAAAKEVGFVLWDKVFNQLTTPWGSVNWERNYMNKYVQKNYEVNLVFCKF
jgi:ParB family chromosome partitioning protein